MSDREASYEVLVIGGGNAALAAAISAAESGARVAILEKAPEALRGGNTYFAGNYRFSWNSLEDDILPLIPNVAEKEVKEMHELAKPHTEEFFYDDVMEVTEGYSDPDLIRVLVSESLPTMKWLRSLGHEWLPSHHNVSSDYMAVRLNGGGARLSDHGFATAVGKGVDIRYQNVAMELLRDSRGRINGVFAETPEGYTKVYAKAVILACGGFEANAAMRAAYLGQGWDRVKTRGVPFNTGDGLRMAWDIGAQPYGNFGGCHALPLDVKCPPFTVRSAPANHTRYPFPWGVLVNVHGQRFLDESLNRPGYTHGKLGQAILRQPQGVAFQILDKKTEHLLHAYIKPTGGKADSLEILAQRLGVEPREFIHTMHEFNKACPAAATFDAAVLDGRSTRGLAVPKSNWALPIDTPPFHGYGVSCGITFTYGGLRINTDSQVMSNWESPIAGLYACGEIAGGFWYINYASGAGMTQGATFGRIAGRNAAKFVREQ